MVKQQYRKLAMIWKELEHMCKGEPIVNVMAEIRKKYGYEDHDDLGSSLSFENGLLNQLDKSFLRDVLSKKRIDAGFFYEWIIRARTFPALRIGKEGIEMPQAFYWKTRLHLIEPDLMEIQKSVGRIYNRVSEKWGTCFVIKDQRIITDVGVVEGLREGEELLEKIRIDFSNVPYHRYMDSFRGLEVEKIDYENNRAYLRTMSESDMGSLLPLPLEISDCRSNGLTKIVALGYPNRYFDERREHDRLVFDNGQRLEFKNAIPGLLVKNGNQHAEYSLSALPGMEGAPIVELSTGKIIGILNADILEQIRTSKMSLDNSQQVGI